MSQLKIAFLWHQHQPFYKDEEGDYLLPWVGLHAMKDYLDLLLIADQYPEIRQTINLVPSLLLQLKDYADGNANDIVVRLSRKSAAEFSTQDKADLLRHFFMGNPATMIQPYPRYIQLYEKYQSIKHLNDRELTGRFSGEEIRDLQIWFNLSWIGYESKKDPNIQGLIKKQQNFSDDDRLMLLNFIHKLFKRVIPKHAEMWQKEQIDLTTSPFYHPILPLLCDTEIAKISQQSLVLPQPPFRHPEDAIAQVEKGLEYFGKTFGSYPSGIWPSEGSVSDEVAEIVASRGIKWIATDEDILSRSLDRPFEQNDIYSPYRIKTNAGDLHLFFRDRALSDKIGFVYGSWSAEEAVNDFLNHLKQIKAKIQKSGGDMAVENSIVPVILDGENCWEYYPENGGKFLHLLYKQLSGNPEFLTTTFTKFLENSEPRELTKIWPGSWINHNFQIWIGDSEDRQAWEMLHQTREFLVQSEKNVKISDEVRSQA
ncbi:MAG: glycoside hydrolase family 57 protein, partial [Calditrichaceae bacterium]